MAIATLAALITACAAFAPLYDRAMQQALTDLAIDHQSAAVVGLQLSAGGDGPDSYVDWSAGSPPPPPETVLSAIPPDVRTPYLDPILGYESTVTPDPGLAEDPTGGLVWRTSQCDHVTFVDGRCPNAVGDLAISEADARNFGYQVGSALTMSGGIPSKPGKLRVTGIYRQVPGDYWFGLVLTGRSGVTEPGPSPSLQHDVWLTARNTFESSSIPARSRARSSADLPLDTAGVGVDEVLSLADAIVDAKAQALLNARHGHLINVYSGLPDIAQDIRSQRDQSRVTVPLLMAQLGLLAVVVLWLVLLAVTEQRRPEVALARLRGRGRRGARALLLGELLPVALIGIVPGLLAAVLGSWFARTVILPGRAPFELRLPVAASVVLAAVVLAAITVLAVVRVAREPVETLLRRVPPRRTRWKLGVADALVVAGAGTLVVAFATGGLDGPIALAAPGLLAIVVGLVLAHLTSPTAAIVGGRLLRRGRVRAGVSVLDAARSPATRRIVAVVTLASALAVFSADAYVVGDRNRATAAEQEAGAPMVAAVSGADLASVRSALDEVDPDGHRVTPVVSILPPGSDTGGTLAVVPDSFREIALFPGSGTVPASVWDGLRAPDTEPIRMTGTHLDVDVASSTLGSLRTDGEPNPVTVGLDLVTPWGETLHTALGDMQDGAEHAHFARDVSCADGCFVTAVWMRTLPGATIEGRATLRDLTTQPGGEVVPIGPADQWTPYIDPREGSVKPSSSSGDEVTFTVKSRGSAEISMLQNWLQTESAALVSGPLPDGSVDGHFDLLGLDGENRSAVEVGDLPRVPGSRPDTTIVNLDVISRGSAISANARIDVWFADDDSALLDDVTAALRDRGIAVTGVTTLDATRSTYDDSVAAWSLALAGLVGGVSLLIALLVLLVSAVSGWRFRTRDLAALRMSGVPRRAIRSMAVAGQLPAVLLGIVAGSVCGLYGAQLALPIVPLFASAPEVSTLDLDTAWTAAILAAVVALVVLGSGASLIGRTLARRSGVRRLRETL